MTTTTAVPPVLEVFVSRVRPSGYRAHLYRPDRAEHVWSCAHDNAARPAHGAGWLARACALLELRARVRARTALEAGTLAAAAADPLGDDDLTWGDTGWERSAAGPASPADQLPVLGLPDRPPSPPEQPRQYEGMMPAAFPVDPPAGEEA